MAQKGKVYVLTEKTGMPDKKKKPDTQRECSGHESWQIYHFKLYLMDKEAKRSCYCHANAYQMERAKRWGMKADSRELDKRR